MNFSGTVYLAPFHSRDVAGEGSIEIAKTGRPVHPGMLFPKRRATFAVDEELNLQWNCYANDISDQNSAEYKRQECPELEHTLDENELPYKVNPFEPLDTEDILRSQYTYGTAPSRAIAGFYDPSFLIIGDGDFNNLQIVNWGTLLKGLEAKPELHSCVQSLKHLGHEKPLYSKLDMTDPTYPIEFYRQRYVGKPYFTKQEAIDNENEDEYAETSIFEAISLEDRVLLVTTVR